MQNLKQAIEANGGITASAEKLAISPQRLSNWIERGVPVESCALVESVMGINRQKLRPSDWQAIWPELATTTKQAV